MDTYTKALFQQCTQQLSPYIFHITEQALVYELCLLFNFNAHLNLSFLLFVVLNACSSITTFGRNI